MASHGLDDRTTPYANIQPRNPARARAHMSIAIRPAGAPAAMMTPIRGALGRIDPELAVSRLSSASDALSETIDKPRFLAAVMVSLSVVALVLAAIGIYGVLSYAVTRRRRELAIRIALGAAPAAVRGTVLARGLVVTMVGVAVGLAGGQALTRLVRSLLFGVEPADVVTLSVVAVVVVAVATLASLLPARRATRMDPVEVLRAE
jgi:ABC-type antimicrobial peptide transport system permease subunit